MLPFVSTIVPVRNEAAHLGATLRSLLVQRYDPDRCEVLVVDGQSTDGTAEVVSALQLEFPHLLLLDNPRQLSSAARNVGVTHARGDYIVIVDGHCEIRNGDYLRDLVAAFERHGVDCLGQPQPLDVGGASLLQQTIALARGSRLGHNPGSHIYDETGGLVKPQSVAVAYRRSVFEQVGLFDESFDACEDVEFNHRVDAAGLTCYLAPELTIHYRPRETLAGLAYQMKRYGRGRARMLLKHPQTFSPLPLVPAMFLSWLATTFLLGLATPMFATAFCGTAIVYSLTVLITGLWLSMRRGTVGLGPILPIVFLAIHVGAGWGVLAELMPRGGRRLLAALRPIARTLGPS